MTGFGIGVEADRHACHPGCAGLLSIPGPLLGVQAERVDDRGQTLRQPGVDELVEESEGLRAHRLIVRAGAEEGAEGIARQHLALAEMLLCPGGLA